MNGYDGLKDDHLQPFFSRQNRRHILIKNGLITEDGYIVRKPEEYLKKKEIYLKQHMMDSENRSQTSEKKKSNPYKENNPGKSFKNKKIPNKKEESQKNPLTNTNCN